MFSISLRRSVVTLAVIAGLLAVAGPASAQGGGADFTRLVNAAPAVTMLDYEGSPLLDKHTAGVNALVPLDVYALVGLPRL